MSRPCIFKSRNVSGLQISLAFLQSLTMTVHHHLYICGFNKQVLVQKPFVLNQVLSVCLL